MVSTPFTIPCSHTKGYICTCEHTHTHTSHSESQIPTSLWSSRASRIKTAADHWRPELWVLNRVDPIQSPHPDTCKTLQRGINGTSELSSCGFLLLKTLSLTLLNKGQRFVIFFYKGVFNIFISLWHPIVKLLKPQMSAHCLVAISSHRSATLNIISSSQLILFNK